MVGPHVRYLVVNVSSPNTPGLRNLQAVSKLEPIVNAVRGAIGEVCPKRHVPLLVKIAPDLSDEDIDAVADMAARLKLDGIIATNTTISRAGLKTEEAVIRDVGAGGLSGAPLQARSLDVLRRLRARLPKETVVISAGGLSSADDAFERLEAGANLLQVYTGFVYGGPLFVHRLNRGLAKLLWRKAGQAKTS